jgi:hypothetical protein
MQSASRVLGSMVPAATAGTRWARRAGRNTSEKLMCGRPPPSGLARQVGQLAHTRAARWFHLHRSRFSFGRAPVDTGRVPEATWKQRSRAALLRGVHGRGANAKGSCIYMYPGILHVAGIGGGQQHLHHSFDPIVAAGSFRRKLRLCCAHERERGERRPGRLS